MNLISNNNKNRHGRHLALAALGVISTFALAGFASAQGLDVGLDEAASIGLATTDIRTMVGNIIKAFLGFIGIVLVALMMYAGFLWMTSQGDTVKIDKAKKIISGAVIGLFIIIASYSIASFIINAVTSSTMGTSTGDCPSGNCCTGSGCGGGLSGGGSGSAFLVNAITPAGAGPNSNGWPRNSLLTVGFNSSVNEASITADTVRVYRCNSISEAYDPGSCSDLVTGTLTLSGSSVVRFAPAPEEGSAESLFDSERWYRILLTANGITSTNGRQLTCFPVIESPASTSESVKHYCERAVAIGNYIDTAGPTVRANAPKSPPSYCAGALLPVSVIASGNDDTLVSTVGVALNNGADDAALVDSYGEPMAVPVIAVNETSINPFRVENMVFVDLTNLAVGTPHSVSVRATDIVGLESDTQSVSFTVKAGHCCNDVKDEDETAVDCGGSCFACSGSICEEDAECASGFCNPTTSRCENRPIIDSISPSSAAPSSMVTISGRNFGSAMGNVVFLGGEGEGDDVTVAACNENAWNGSFEPNSVVVQVPNGVVTGPVRLVTSSGVSDSTDDAYGPITQFNVTGDLKPGICYINPDSGSAGTSVTVNGGGFGSPADSSIVLMGVFPMSIQQGGWATTAINTLVPATVTGGAQNVRVSMNGLESNAVPFSVTRAAGEAEPRIISVSPENGPPGTYVTIYGTGFGSRQGKVTFRAQAGGDEAIGTDTNCGVVWHDDYVVVKVPEKSVGGSTLVGGAYAVELSTAAPIKTSNADVKFTLTGGTPGPGICELVPNNGLPGQPIVIMGDNLGTPTANPALSPRYGVDFFKTNGQPLGQNSYGTWNSTKITQVYVPGSRSDEDTWPNSGPVSVMSANVRSVNTLPFEIRNCNDSGSCEDGTVCCASGSCQESCTPVARSSAYGWRLSTEVLPTLPTVVERFYCGTGVAQSPSPYKGTQDACLNASLFVEFTRPLDRTTFDSAVTVQECTGEAGSLACTTAVPVLVTAMGCDDFNNCGSLSIEPSDAYNNSTGDLKSNSWYRVTLLSNAVDGGLRETADAGGHYLDGDRNRVEGGDYVFEFRTQADATPCRVGSMSVNPGRRTLSDKDFTYDFDALPFGENCNVLRCDESFSYSVDWAQTSDHLDLALPISLSRACRKPVKAVKETPPAVSIELRGSISDDTTSVMASSDVMVAFERPQIVEVGPTSGCLEACNSALTYAKFSVPMDEDSLTAAGNFELWRCRNNTCLPPHDYANSPTNCEVEVSADGKMVMLENCTKFDPSTFYVASIRGGASGVKSTTGGLMTGLNDGDYYRWKFRIADSPKDACTVYGTSVEPKDIVFNYVGERAGVDVFPRSAPDECSVEGQILSASDFNWQWSLGSPNPSVGGYVTGESGVHLSVTNPVDTASVRPMGCTSNCSLSGSQSHKPQCGDGIIEGPFETCDSDADWCGADCLLKGKSSELCGNGVIDPGEECEAVPESNVVGAAMVFPVGCKKPEGVRGCIKLGATASGSVCGDGFVGEGENCDDGNKKSGDGCSADCLGEGSLKSCSVTGEPCTSLCGNGVTDPGEDASCDPATATCDLRCLRNDAMSCEDGTGYNCGSSAFYSSPSFCGDNIVGLGETSSCESSPDGKVDPYQVLQAKPMVSGFDGLSKESRTSRVTASLPDVDPSRVVPADVTLNCSCRNYGTTPDENDSYCTSFMSGLGCGSDSCCRPRPNVFSVMPAGDSENQCRNTAVTVAFDQLMDSASLSEAFTVGFDSGSTDADACANMQSSNGGWFHRVMSWIGEAVHSALSFALPANSASAPSSNTFCEVRGSVRIEHDTETDHSWISFEPDAAYPANTWIRIQVNDSAKSSFGVTMDSAFNSYFRTSGNVCTLDYLSMDGNTLVTKATNDGAKNIRVVGMHYGDGGRPDQQVVPVAEYTWLWDFDAPLPETESAVLLRDRYDDGKIKPTAVVRARNPIYGDSPGDFVPKNGETDFAAYAKPDEEAIGTISNELSVSGTIVVNFCGNIWPATRTCSPFGTATVPGSAFVACTPGASVWSPFQDSATNFSFYYCRDNGNEQLLPQIKESTQAVIPGRDIVREFLMTFEGGLRDAIGVRISKNMTQQGLRAWYAIKGFSGQPTAMKVDGYDALADGRSTYVSIAALGNVRSDNLLPAYTNIVTMTYTDSATEDVKAVFSQVVGNVDFNATLDDKRSCDIVRNGVNVEKMGCRTDDDCWRGDNGTVVESYKDKYICKQWSGQCGYRCDTDADCAANGTNYNLCNSSHSCYRIKANGNTATGKPPGIGRPQFCQSDIDCRLRGDNDEYDEFRGEYTCDADKSKLARDMTRIQDTLMSRAKTLDVLARTGEVPTLQTGSFLPSLSVSAWGSWTDVLVFSADPVNRFNNCPTNYSNRSECWDSYSRVFMCTEGSYVYQYQSLGKKDFLLKADLESRNIIWNSETCIGLSESACTPAAGCQWSNSRCNFITGKVQIGGFYGDAARNCTNAAIGFDSLCGNGIVGSGEICEIGQTKSESCTEGGRTGMRSTACSTDCRSWVPDACLTGFCGDGVIQAPEKCDDGEQNGTYGKCRTDCTGASFRCGDGLTQAVEACDCGIRNGQYVFNGVPSPWTSTMSGETNLCNSTSIIEDAGGAASCSWNCEAAGPNCGDGVKNGHEICDGEVQSYKGYCNDSAKTGCNTTDDCPSGKICGNFCPRAEQQRVRYCNTNDKSTTADDANACKWGNWVCSDPGFCGNGVKEEGELCDDGNANNTDGCVIDVNRGTNFMCKLPRCGDYHTQPATGEECDNGLQNGIACIPEYGLSCTFCSASCKVQTTTGGFCGDAILQSAEGPLYGPEQCDTSRSISGEWICLSTKPEDESLGYPSSIDGGLARPSCSNRCAFNCGDARRVCLADTESGDFDDDGIMSNCDPDDDNDAVPDFVDCRPLDVASYPSYSYVSSTEEEVTIPPPTERCDGCDNDCDGVIDESIPGIHDRVDMVFALDASGSMTNSISGLLGYLKTLAADLARTQDFAYGTDVRMGLVRYAQDATTPPLGYEVLLDLAEPSEFRDFAEQNAARDLTISGGFEPTWIISDELVKGNIMMNWRSNAKRYVIVMTDEIPFQPYVGDNTAASSITITEQPGGNVKIDWADVEGASFYKLYRSIGTMQSFQEIPGQIPSSEFTHLSFNFTDNTQYFYQVVTYRNVDGVLVSSSPTEPVGYWSGPDPAPGSQYDWGDPVIVLPEKIAGNELMSHVSANNVEFFAIQLANGLTSSKCYSNDWLTPPVAGQPTPEYFYCEKYWTHVLGSDMSRLLTGPTGSTTASQYRELFRGLFDDRVLCNMCIAGECSSTPYECGR